ncbi:recombinase family protein, partial [Magnetovibrio blakemorei]|uniref:recombinase family protein n=1 Tax=Magnetovibrio blakemorei TaxID=28181 RepID=UPI0009FC27CA
MTETLHIYTRVSTVTQEEQGTSLEVQLQLGITKAKELGFEYKHWNEGGKSSRFENLENRPVMKRLLLDIEDGNAHHLWAYTNDRLSRNDITQQTIKIALQRHGVKLYTKDGEYDLNNAHDKFIKTILDSMGEYENAMRAEKSRLGKINKLRKFPHSWIGGPPPFGYEIFAGQLVESTDESMWVHRMYELFVDGNSSAKIKNILDANSVKTRRCKPSWSLGSIQKILQNPLYLGSFEYRDKKLDETVTCQCPPLLSLNLWNAAQDRRKQVLQRKGQVNRSTKFYLLRDLMVCEHCGTPMGGRDKPQKGEHLYYCPSKEREWVKEQPSEDDKWQRGRGCGMARSLNIGRTDEIVVNTVSKTLSDPQHLHDLLRSRYQSEGDFKQRKALLRRHKRRSEKELQHIETSLCDLETEYRLNHVEESIYRRVRD